MKRFKKKPKVDRNYLTKKAEELLQKEVKKEADHLADQLYPVIILACKDEMRMTVEQVVALDKRVERYMNYIGNGITGLDEVMALINK